MFSFARKRSEAIQSKSFEGFTKRAPQLLALSSTSSHFSNIAGNDCWEMTFLQNLSWHFDNISVVWICICSYKVNSNGFDKDSRMLAGLQYDLSWWSFVIYTREILTIFSSLRKVELMMFWLKHYVNTGVIMSEFHLRILTGLSFLLFYYLCYWFAFFTSSTLKCLNQNTWMNFVFLIVFSTGSASSIIWKVELSSFSVFIKVWATFDSSLKTSQLKKISWLKKNYSGFCQIIFIWKYRIYFLSKSFFISYLFDIEGFITCLFF